MYAQTCAMCGDYFPGREYRQASADNRRFCSPRCKQRHYRLRMRLATLQREVARIEALIG